MIFDENSILKKENETLKNIGKNLKAEILLLKDKLSNYEKEKFKVKFCIHCKNEYNPIKNDIVTDSLIKNFCH